MQFKPHYGKAHSIVLVTPIQSRGVLGRGEGVQS